MAIKLSQIAAQRATTEVEFEGGAKLTVVHNPSAFTPEFEALIREEEDSKVASQFLIKMLCKLIHEWDLVDDEGTILGADHVGEVVPVTQENLCKVPFTVLGAISSAVLEEHKPVKKSDAPTRSGSFS